MSKYIPYPFYYDDVPIDISFIFKGEKPAGKHGFLKTKGDKFVFEDGTEARFWGTNLNGGANFPEHSYADILASRLAKIGINLVRFHQLDAQWNTPNIFSFAKGKRVDNTLSFDTESLDRLDYLISALKSRGIYCYMDMFTYRKFKSGDGVENAHLLGDAAKPYGNFSRKLIDLQKDLCHKLWEHKNPYTGLRYCDDPVFAMAEITNESDLLGGNPTDDMIEPYKTEFKELFDAWLKSNNMGRTAADFDINDLGNDTVLDFRIYLTEKYYKEMYDCMRASGVKIPIAGTNWNVSPALAKTQETTDYIDGHSYHYTWKWSEFEHRCITESVTQRKESFLVSAALATPIGMPCYISEWDMPWPNEYRAESVLYASSVGMLQGWSGFAIHTYAYTNGIGRMNILGKELSSAKVGNIPYREGVFSTWNDPAKFGLFYHAALITRRGDVSEANTTLALTPKSMRDFDWDKAYANIEHCKVVSDFENQNTDIPKYADNKEVLSDTGELYINREKNIGSINTPMTKCAYGFIGRNDAVELDGVRIKGITDFGVVALSSLTDDEITKSDNILMTTVGRVQNTGCKFENGLMTDIGSAPVIAEVVEAQIEIKTAVEGLSVWAISAEGLYIGTLPSSYENGWFKFKTGDVSQSIYYLIVKD